MSNWTIGRRIAAGYAILLVLLVLVAGVGMYALATTRDTFGSALETERDDVQKGLAATKAFSDANREFRGFLFSGDEQFLSGLREHLEVARTGLADLRDRSEGTERSAHWNEVLQALESWAAAADRAVAAKQAGQEREAQRIFVAETLPRAQKEDRLIRSSIQTEQDRADAVARSASSTASNAFWTVLVVAALALLSGIAIASGLARSITRRLRETIATLASASNEILAATTQQAAGALQEETAVQETSATVDEVKQTVQVSTEKADTVAESVRRTAAISEEGRRAVDESIDGARRAKAQMQAIAERILALSEQALAIGEITASVNEVAEQSNLLAVNASIEAAKAGEAGKGFGVVAAEVKALAERSKQAAGEIRRLLAEIQQATQGAVMATEQGVKASEAGEAVSARAGEAIHVLVDNLTESAQAAQQILASSQQQMTGMDQVALAMQNIQQAASQNMAATRQVEQAAQSLNELAQTLSELVAVNGSGRRNGRRRA